MTIMEVMYKKYQHDFYVKKNATRWCCATFEEFMTHEFLDVDKMLKYLETFQLASYFSMINKGEKSIVVFDENNEIIDYYLLHKNDNVLFFITDSKKKYLIINEDASFTHIEMFKDRNDFLKKVQKGYDYYNIITNAFVSVATDNGAVYTHTVSKEIAKRLMNVYDECWAAYLSGGFIYDDESYLAAIGDKKQSSAQEFFSNLPLAGWIQTNLKVN